MQWDFELVSEVLIAKIETLSMEHGKQYFLWFNGNAFKFYLHMQPEIDTVMLAADPVELTGMPLFVYSFNCNLIKVIDSPYHQRTKAVYFYEDSEPGEEIRLAMNLRDDGRWYIWCNAWKKY